MSPLRLSILITTSRIADNIDDRLAAAIEIDSWARTQTKSWVHPPAHKHEAGAYGCSIHFPPPHHPDEGQVAVTYHYYIGERLQEEGLLTMLPLLIQTSPLSRYGTF